MRLLKTIVLILMLFISALLSSCAKSAENEHLPKYCQTYSGFISVASKDLYELVGDINRFNYLSVISEIELEFEVDDPSRDIDLSGIQCFQNLTSITLIGQSFKDISPMSALKNIQKIALIDTSIVSIDSFKNLSKVNELTISNSKSLQSVDGIQEMTKLTRLDLSDNGIVNIEGLNNLVNLQELILRNNEIPFLPSIDQLEFLETLDVSNNKIAQLGDDLSGLSNLKIFIATNNQICDLSTLDDLISIEILDLSYNNLGCNGDGVSPDFSSLEVAFNLRELYLNNNDLTSISDLEDKSLPLEVLHLENNRLSDITPIANYTGIKELVLYGNNIVNINDLSGMTSLTEIDLSENAITDFSDLLQIPGLQDIDLSDNAITTIPDINTSWANLVRLDLDGNNLTDTSGVNGHPTLQTLILSNNGLTELQGISNLPQLESLIMQWEVPDPVPDDYIPEPNPNSISIIRNSFNQLPSLNITLDTTNSLFLNIPLGDNIEIYNSIQGLETVEEIDFEDMDIQLIDADSIQLSNLITLNIKGTMIADISFVLGNPNLVQLDISNTQVQNLSIINGSSTSDLDNLEYVLAQSISVGNDLNSAFIDLPDLSGVYLTDTVIHSITNSFNDLEQLTTIEMDGEFITTIDSSFNNLFSVYNNENSILFEEGALQTITASFNQGQYEDITIQTHNVDDGALTSITTSFNDLNVQGVSGITIQDSDFSTISGSFNDSDTTSLSISNSHVSAITSSFVNLTVQETLSLADNALATITTINQVASIQTLILEGNQLNSVSFLDGINGLENLNISDQFNEQSDMTLTSIDGINNMPSLIGLTMENITISSIDGFRNIGIKEFNWDKSVNNSEVITTISNISFENSQITTLNLRNHELQDVAFLQHLAELTSLEIGLDTSDLSGFMGAPFVTTLDSLYIQSKQNTPNLSPFSDYDELTTFSFASEATTQIQQFDGLKSITTIDFLHNDIITTIADSFNTMPSLSLSRDYLSNYTRLSQVQNSFDVYQQSDAVVLSETLIITDSFNTVGTVEFNASSQNAPLFDLESFDSVLTFIFEEANYIDYSFLNGYTSLQHVEITLLQQDLTGLDNHSIMTLSISTAHETVDTFDMLLNDEATFIMSSPSTSIIELTSNNSNFDVTVPLGNVTLHNTASQMNLSFNTNNVTINNNIVTDIELDEYISTSSLLQTNQLQSITSTHVLSTIQATSFDVITTVESFAFDLDVNTITLTNPAMQTVNGNNSGDLIVYDGSSSLQVDYTGDILQVLYHTLDTITLEGVHQFSDIQSNALASISQLTGSINALEIQSNQPALSISGIDIPTIDIVNNIVNTLDVSVLGATITLHTTSTQPLSTDIEANSFTLDGLHVPSITLDDTSILSTLTFTTSSRIEQITLQQAVVDEVLLTTSKSALDISGNDDTVFTIDAINLNDVSFITNNASYNVTTEQTSLSGKIIASNVTIKSAEIVTTSLDTTSEINSLTFEQTTSLETINVADSVINSLIVESSAVTMNIISRNVETLFITNHDLTTLSVDSNTNNISFLSDNTNQLTLDIIARNLDISTKTSDITFASFSVIETLHFNTSSNLATLTLQDALITSINIIETSNTLTVSGTNITELFITSDTITSLSTTLNANAEVSLTSTSEDTITMDTTTEELTISVIGDFHLTSASLQNIIITDGDAIRLTLFTPALSLHIDAVATSLQIIPTSLNDLFISDSTTLNILEVSAGSMASFTLNNAEITTFEYTGDNPLFTLDGNDFLTEATLNLAANTSLQLLNVENSTINYDTQVATTAISGVADTLTINGLNATDVDVTSLNVANLTLNTSELVTFDDFGVVSNELTIITTQNNSDITTQAPNFIFTGNNSHTGNLTTSLPQMQIETSLNEVTINATSTEIVIEGENLSIVRGNVDTIDISNNTDDTNLSLDIDASRITVNNNTVTSLFLLGTHTVPTVEITSSSMTMISTNNVIITTLIVDATGVDTVIDTLASTVTHIGPNNDLEFAINSDTQQLFTNSSNVIVRSTSFNNANLTYTGNDPLTISYNGINDAQLIMNLATDVSVSGNTYNLEIIGPQINTLSSDSLQVTNDFVLNDSFMISLDFMSSELINSVSRVIMNTITDAGSVIDALEGTDITLISPITNADLYDAYYANALNVNTTQEELTNIWYNTFRDAAIDEALSAFREQIVFDYLTDSYLKQQIDTNSYSSLTTYFDGYLASIGKTEQQLVTEEGQAYVDNLKQDITDTLNDDRLIISESELQEAVEQQIIENSEQSATNSVENKTYSLG